MGVGVIIASETEQEIFEMLGRGGFDLTLSCGVVLKFCRCTVARASRACEVVSQLGGAVHGVPDDDSEVSMR